MMNFRNRVRRIEKAFDTPSHVKHERAIAEAFRGIASAYKTAEAHGIQEAFTHLDNVREGRYH